MNNPGDVKRDTRRIELLGGLSGEVMVFQPMLIREISMGGVQIETAFPLQLDSLHDFRLTLSGGQSVVIKGRVAHSHISDVDQDIIRYRSGVEFIEPSERVTLVIAEFMEVLRRSHSSQQLRIVQIDAAD
jgi:hypothetical protein